MIKFDFIIISYNTKSLTIQCINSLYKSLEKLNYLYKNKLINENIVLGELIVVDNGSVDGTLEEIKLNYKEIKLIENNENLGYAKACNLGIKSSKSDYFIISNSDIIVYPSSIIGIIKTLNLSKVALAGVQQLFPNYKWQRSWGYVPGFKLAIYNLFFIELIINKFKSKKFSKLLDSSNFGKILDFETNLDNNLESNLNVNLHKFKLQNVPYLDGAFLGFNRLELAKNCYFDEDFFFYTEELELCFRVNKNHRKVVFNPNYYVIHYRGGSDTAISKNEKFKFNPTSLKLLYDTKLLFAKKHLNKLKSRFYFFSEFSLFYHSYILALIFGFTKLGNKKEVYKFLMKINYNNLKNI